jgi:hypothetical protein
MREGIESNEFVDCVTELAKLCAEAVAGAEAAVHEVASELWRHILERWWTL